MTNIVTLSGEPLRTAADVIAELQRKHAAGEITHLLAIITSPSGSVTTDWSAQPSKDFVYSCGVIQQQLLWDFPGSSAE